MADFVGGQAGRTQGTRALGGQIRMMWPFKGRHQDSSILLHPFIADNMNLPPFAESGGLLKKIAILLR